MKPCRHITASVLVLFAYLYSIPASATNYQDWWWNPAQSGQGVNIGQQDNTLFASWFTYDQNGTGIFLVMAGSVINNKVTGDLIRTVGPALGTAFNPDLVVRTVVGTATLTFSDANNATLQSTVNGISGTLALTRFTFSTIYLRGPYYGGVIATWSNCANSANNGSYLYSATYTGSSSGNTTNIYESHPNGAICTYSGPYSQAGSRLQAAGSYSCSDGTQGSWSVQDLTVTDSSFVGKFVAQQFNNSACHVTGTIGGLSQ